MIRKEIFKKGDIYHIFNRSIAGFQIFKNKNNGWCFMDRLEYYNNKLVKKSFSRYLQDNIKYDYQNLLIPQEHPHVKYISYTIMPTHYHLVVKILTENEFSSYMSNVENSFSRHFNLKFKRKGPLWESRFKAVKIANEKQLLHLTRYVHLNAVTDYLVDKPEEWEQSSYRDYINNTDILGNIISELSMKNPKHYKKYVEDQIDYQRKLKKIKKLILE